ncbi:MFS transporter [Xylariales sp. AK1849]|nr:MFS transporter [Xylariales sp. AK1849]
MAEEKNFPTQATPVDAGLGSSSVLPRQNAFQRVIHRKNDLNELGKEMLRQSLQYDQAQLERDAIKVRRKLDFLVLPMMMTTYMLSFLDQQTLNYSNAYGLQSDTHMSGDDHAWLASALYFGWLCGAWPWNFLLQSVPIAKFIGGMLFVWGAVCMLQAAVFNFSGFFAIRFFLGMLEGCISPAWVLLTSMLWTRSEQPIRGSLLAYGSGVTHGLTIPNWKLIYLTVGALTIAWGFVILLYLPDGPHDAKMLNEYERVVAVWRVSKNQMGIKHSAIKPSQLKETLLDCRCYLIFMTGITIGILNGGVTNFMSAIIKGFDFDSLTTSLLQAPGGAFEIVGCLLFGHLSQYPNMVGVAIILSCLPGMAGLIGILKIPIKNRYALVAMCWMQNMVGAPIILNWMVPGINVAGHTKRNTILGIYFVCYVVGNIIGPHMFLTKESPRYPTAIKALLGTYCAVIFFRELYTIWCWNENQRRDKQGMRAEAMEDELFEGFEDLTDKENKHFRYKL